MDFYNRKCKGCGLYFSDKENEPSYIKKPSKDTLYCIRCFKLKHYGKIDNSSVNEQDINSVLQKIVTKDNLVFMILDLFDLKNSLIEDFKDHPNIFFLVNKLNCLPPKFKMMLSLEKIKAIINSEGYFCNKICFYDAYPHKNISIIMQEIHKNFLNKKIAYVVGKTNVGKSSLINALLKFNKMDHKLSVSPFPNTTLNLLKIKIDKYTIIDTPGYINNSNVLNLLDHSSLSIINKNSKFIYKNFLIKDTKQIFFLENLFCIQINKIDVNPNICFYINSIFKIHRTNLAKKDKIIEKKNDIFKFSLPVHYEKTEKNIELDANKKYNIFVSGICLISLKGISNITIEFPIDIDIYVTENAII